VDVFFEHRVVMFRLWVFCASQDIGSESPMMSNPTQLNLAAWNCLYDWSCL